VQRVSCTATTRDNATGSRSGIVVAVTARRAEAFGGASLEAGVGTPDPLAGARDDAGASSGDGSTS